MSLAKSKNEKKELLSARCNSHVKEVLTQLSQTEHLAMSEIITKSILEYYQRHFPNQSFLKTEQELFGRYNSGKRDLSINRKQYLKEGLGAKHRSG